MAQQRKTDAEETKQKLTGASRWRSLLFSSLLDTLRPLISDTPTITPNMRQHLESLLVDSQIPALKPVLDKLPSPAQPKNAKLFISFIEGLLQSLENQCSLEGIAKQVGISTQQKARRGMVEQARKRFPVARETSTDTPSSDLNPTRTTRKRTRPQSTSAEENSTTRAALATSLKSLISSPGYTGSPNRDSFWALVTPPLATVDKFEDLKSSMQRLPSSHFIKVATDLATAIEGHSSLVDIVDRLLHVSSRWDRAPTSDHLLHVSGSSLSPSPPAGAAASTYTTFHRKFMAEYKSDWTDATLEQNLVILTTESNIVDQDKISRMRRQLQEQRALHQHRREILNFASNYLLVDVPSDGHCGPWALLMAYHFAYERPLSWDVHQLRQKLRDWQFDHASPQTLEARKRYFDRGYKTEYWTDTDLENAAELLNLNIVIFNCLPKTIVELAVGSFHSDLSDPVLYIFGGTQFPLHWTFLVPAVDLDEALRLTKGRSLGSLFKWWNEKEFDWRKLPKDASSRIHGT